jgi:putative ABC transport system substrate-binding protein
MIRRREFMLLLGCTVALPTFRPPQLLAQRRPTKIPRIGIIDDAPIWDSFRQALRELGYVEGRTIAFEYRTAGGEPERLAAAAAELVRLPVDVIAVYGTAPARAASLATTSIPIVAVSVGDPVRAGLVVGLARPGSNVTGFSVLGPDIAAKRLQLLKEVIPTVERVAFLWNPDNASHAAYLEELRAAAPALGMQMICTWPIPANSRVLLRR